jgi:hypothetical protein
MEARTELDARSPVPKDGCREAGSNPGRSDLGLEGSSAEVLAVLLLAGRAPWARLTGPAEGRSPAADSSHNRLTGRCQDLQQGGVGNGGLLAREWPDALSHGPAPSRAWSPWRMPGGMLELPSSMG